MVAIPDWVATVLRPPPRSEYERMSRRELIDALCARDAGTSPADEEARRNFEEHTQRLRRLEIDNRKLLRRDGRAETARDRYMDLFAQAPLAYCVLDDRGVVLDANDATASLLRVHRMALIGVPFWRAVALENEAALRNHITRCIGRGEREELDLHVSVPGRGRLVLRATSAPVQESGACVVSCGTVLGDVTGFARNERALRFQISIEQVLLGASLDPRDVLDAAAAACVPELGDACFVDVVTESGPPRRARTVGVTTATTAVLERHGEDEAWRRYEQRLLQTLTPLFEPASAAALGAPWEAELGARGLLVVPLVARGFTLGALGAITTNPSRTYALRDFDLARKVADRVASSLLTALLHRRP